MTTVNVRIQTRNGPKSILEHPSRPHHYIELRVIGMDATKVTQHNFHRRRFKRTHRTVLSGEPGGHCTQFELSNAHMRTWIHMFSVVHVLFVKLARFHFSCNRSSTEKKRSWNYGRQELTVAGSSSYVQESGIPAHGKFNTSYRQLAI